MNISVYFYKEDGSYDYMDMVPLEFDSEGVQIVPENSTAQYPPDIATDPRFSKELNKWVPQVEVQPFDSTAYLKTIEQVREEFYKVSQESVEKVSATSKESLDSSVKELQTKQEEALKEVQTKYEEALKGVAEDDIAGIRDSLEGLNEQLEIFKEGQNSHAQRLARLEGSLERTRYYLTIVLPHAKHYFEN